MKFPLKSENRVKGAQARGRRSGECGFSLPEVLFASALTGFSAVSVFSGFSMGLNLLDTTRQELRATQVLEEKLEVIRLYNWDQIKTVGFIPATFTARFNPAQTNSGSLLNGTVTVTNVPVVEAAYSTNLCQVTVSVNWTTGQNTHQRSMSTLVSRYGIQSYVY